MPPYSTYRAYLPYSKGKAHMYADARAYLREVGDHRANESGYATASSVERQAPTSPLNALIGIRLGAQYLSKTLLERFLNEREQLRERQHEEVMLQITDLSSQVFGLQNLYYNRFKPKHLLALEAQKAQLERDLVEIDLNCWRDTTSVRERLIDKTRSYESAKLQTGMLNMPRSADGA